MEGCGEGREERGRGEEGRRAEVWEGREGGTGREGGGEGIKRDGMGREETRGKGREGKGRYGPATEPAAMILSRWVRKKDMVVAIDGKEEGRVGIVRTTSAAIIGAF